MPLLSVHLLLSRSASHTTHTDLSEILLTRVVQGGQSSNFSAMRWHKKVVVQTSLVSYRWKKVGQLSELWCFPMKSCGNIAMSEVDCGQLGPHLGHIRDRVFAVVHPNGDCITARTYPRMLVSNRTLIISLLSNWNISYQNSQLHSADSTWNYRWRHESYGTGHARHGDFNSCTLCDESLDDCADKDMERYRRVHWLRRRSGTLDIKIHSQQTRRPSACLLSELSAEARHTRSQLCVQAGRRCRYRNPSRWISILQI